jgi:hypothetical protein
MVDRVLGGIASYKGDHNRFREVGNMMNHTNVE